MSTVYPTSLDAFSTVVDNVDDVLAAHQNDRADSIEALEVKIGVDNSAVATSLDYFLKNASGSYRTHYHDGTSDDGAQLDWDSCFSDAAHNHSSAAEGGTSLSGITALTVANDVDIGSYEWRAQTFESDVATGTAPLVVASTTKVTNLNADLLDGYDTSTVGAANKIYVSDASGYLPDAIVDTTALKTTTGTVSLAANGNVVLPGGEYAFYPQIRRDSGTAVDIFCCPYGITTASFATLVGMFFYTGSSVQYTWQSRYVTASGNDYWAFLMVERSTSDIVGAWAAPDHPSYGNGDDFIAIPHPFHQVDLSKYEIVLVDYNDIQNILVMNKNDIAPQLMSSYKITEDSVYTPRHSGRFHNKIPIMVDVIPSYIRCKHIVKLNSEELYQKKELKRKKDELLETQRVEKEKWFKNKLGLTTEELRSLKEVLL